MFYFWYLANEWNYIQQKEYTLVTALDCIVLIYSFYCGYVKSEVIQSILRKHEEVFQQNNQLEHSINWLKRRN